MSQLPNICAHCETDIGYPELGLSPRPSKKKVNICPSCRIIWDQVIYWPKEEGEESDNETEIGSGDGFWGSDVRPPNNQRMRFQRNNDYQEWDT